MLQDRSLGLIQPDVARSGGITETWRIAELAAELQHRLRAACRLVRRDLRRRQPAARGRGRDAAAPSSAWSTTTRCATLFTHPVVGEGSQLVDGQLPVPQGPGLGIEIDRDMLARSHPDCAVSDCSNAPILPCLRAGLAGPAHGRRHHLPAGDLRALAQPAPVLLRAGGDLRRLRQLRQGAGRPLLLAGAAQHGDRRRWSSCMSNCCSAC